jgi:DNA-binding NtrC family response regulator
VLAVVGMPSEAENRLPTTASGATLRDSEVVTALRWVYPPRDLVTILAEVPVVLGRAPSSTTELDTERVSRKHAELTRISTGHLVRDLDSKNGTFVNGEKIVESPLRTGDVLRLGDCIAVVEAVRLDGLITFRDLGQGVLGGPMMASVTDRLREVAAAGSDVHLVGETGTGRELLARAFHRLGAREGAFVVFDCTSDNESTRTGELLGRSEHALPPGEHPSIGHVRAAHRGTLVLDAVPDLSRELQEKLVEVLERREVTPLGERQPTPVDVRFVAKSTVPFEEQRPEHLSARLREHFDGLTVTVPPLRKRRADVVPLFLWLLERYARRKAAKLEPELVEHLCLHDWPMNVRELDGVARRLASKVGEEEHQLDQLVEAFPSLAPRAGRVVPAPPPSRRALTSYPRDQLAALRRALERHSGNLTKAASELDITRSKAYRMLKMAEDD